MADRKSYCDWLFASNSDSGILDFTYREGRSRSRSWKKMETFLSAHTSLPMLIPVLLGIPILTLTSKRSPTKNPNKSVKLTGCPLSFLSLISLTRLRSQDGLKSIQIQLLSTRSRISSFTSSGWMFGHLGCEYRVERYLNKRYL